MAKKDIDVIAYGTEPKADVISAELPSYERNLADALNWFNYMRDEKDATKYLLTYLKNEKRLTKELESAIRSKWFPGTYGWVARLINKGATLSEKHLGMLELFLASRKPVEKEEPKKVEAPKVVRAKPLPEYFGELEGRFDDYWVKENAFSLKKFFKSFQVTATHQKMMVDILNEKLEELKREVDEEEMGYINRPKVKRVIKMLEGQLNDETLFTKPVREAKVIPPEKLVAGLKFMPKDEATGVKSVDPKKIIGAKAVWLYNAKYRILTLLRSVDGFVVDPGSTTIKGIETDLSIAKTLRKPDEILPLVVAGKTGGLMEKLTTKPSAFSGRLNNDTVIVGVS